ncbi:flagellar protein FlaG [Thalassotalea sp. LPB0316]|uniref:flagellar protein FlaG n=1 Tax=Thalassotalea sp. LPB0316 TaxID=2769490 RepID=UPI001865E7A4|nr:flagellar protein FlaG [Thalassotalea sp. LPB0316]QOL27075.1 flagellar protein FlaG [Thalassotalea sp. LPB0316]
MAIESIADKSKFNAAQINEPVSLNVGLNVAGDKVAETAKAETANDESNLNKQARIEQEKAEAKEREVDREALLESIKQINADFPIKETSLVFEFDELNEPPIVKVIDKENGETIREIPPKYFSDVSSVLKDISGNKSSSGILLDQQV